jgi:5-methylcytosine-specific restriction protein A
MPPTKSHSAGVRKKRQAIYDEARGSARQRGYSTEWDKFARAYLKSNPLCFYCQVQGRTSPAELVDHIVPHRGNMERFWPPLDGDQADFFCGCCNDCHNGPKQRAERTADRLGADVREILVRWGMLPEGWPGSDPDAPIRSAGATIITGPPLSGKTVLAEQLAKEEGGRIYDLDEIAQDIGLPRYGRTPEQALRAIQERDIRLLSHSARARLIMIVSAPTARERLYWERRTSGRMINLMEPRGTLVQRARRRTPGDVAAIQSQVSAIDFWLSRADV